MGNTARRSRLARRSARRAKGDSGGGSKLTRKSAQLSAGWESTGRARTSHVVNGGAVARRRSGLHADDLLLANLRDVQTRGRDLGRCGEIRVVEDHRLAQDLVEQRGGLRSGIIFRLDVVDRGLPAATGCNCPSSRRPGRHRPCSELVSESGALPAPWETARGSWRFPCRDE